MKKFLLIALLAGGFGLLSTTDILAAADQTRPMMSREALRYCMAQQSKLEALNAEISKGQAALKTELKAIDKMEAQLTHDKMSLDNSNSIAVEMHNARVEERDTMITKHNAKIESLNKKSAELNAENASYQGQCAGKDYDEADKTAILSGK